MSSLYTQRAGASRPSTVLFCFSLKRHPQADNGRALTPVCLKATGKLGTRKRVR
jgi:hypothetical protein